jgi:hypothetical protein
MGAKSDMFISFNAENKAQIESILGQFFFGEFTEVMQHNPANPLVCLNLGSHNNAQAYDLADELVKVGLVAQISISNCDDCDIEDTTLVIKQAESGQWEITEKSKTEAIISVMMQGLLNDIELCNLSVEQIKSKIQAMV